ncbi:MAG: glycosyltransferase family 4 protein, partial [bacterium]
SPTNLYDLETTPEYRTLPALDLPLLRENTSRFGFYVFSLTFVMSVLSYVTYQHLSGYEPVVYSRDIISTLILARLRKATGLNLPIFHALHDFPGSMESGRIDTWRLIDGFVVNSNGLKDKVLDAGIQSNKLMVEYNGVDYGTFQASTSQDKLRKEYDLPLDRTIVGFTGNPYDYNGINVILDLAEKMPEIHFVTVGGSGDRLQRLKDRKTNRQLKNLRIVPHQPHREIPRYLKAFDQLLLPLQPISERTKDFACPLKLFEYLASGRPIIASDIPCLRDIVDDEKEALLVEYDNVEDYQEAVLRLSSDNKLNQQMSQAARTLAENQTWENRAKRILDFIDQRADVAAPTP